MSDKGGGDGNKPRPLPNLAGGSKGPKKKPAQSTIIGQLPPRPPAPPSGGQGAGGPRELDQGASSAWGVPQQPSQPAPPPRAPSPPPPGNPFGSQSPTPPPPSPPPAGNPFGAQSTPAPAAPPPSPFGAPAGAPPGRAPGAPPSGAGAFFPQAPQPTAPVAPRGPKIALNDALAAVGVGTESSANPIIAAASDLLVLFGRLRTGLVEMSAQPLLEHVTRQIEAFDSRLAAAHVDPHQAQIAKYVICGTADDVVQNIPGADRNLWLQYSMAARFFNVRTTGEGVFHEIDKALQSPEAQADLLELMLVCISLGFEGKYRASPNGGAELQQYRSAIFNALLSVREKFDDDLSPRWQGVVLKGKNFGATPVWAVASVVGLVLFGAWLTFRILLAQDGSAAAAVMAAATPDGAVRIDRPDPVPEYIPPPPPSTTQLERIQSGMAAEISAGTVEITQTQKFIVVRMNNVVLFDSGQADVKAGFAPLAERLGGVLNNEQGQVLVVGHTDNIPLSGRGRFKDNQELSVARAKSVAALLGGHLSTPERIKVIGEGADSPIASNDTPDGRALNRRVDVLIQREETL